MIANVQHRCSAVAPVVELDPISSLLQAIFLAGVVEEAATAPRAEPACPSSSLRCFVSIVRISEAHEG